MPLKRLLGVAPSTAASEDDDVALIPNVGNDSDDSTEDEAKRSAESSSDVGFDDRSPWYQYLTLAELGLVITDFVILITTLGLLSFVCLIAMMNGQKLDSRYPYFQDALTVVRHLVPSSYFT